jgi:hypothetical protein
VGHVKEQQGGATMVKGATKLHEAGGGYENQCHFQHLNLETCIT